MQEHLHVRQIPGEPRRRWFSSDDFDLILWLNDDRSYGGFELCYDKQGHERALIWRPGLGFAHMTVDDGENRPGRYKATPVLLPDGNFDARRLAAAFEKESASLPYEIAAYVLQALRQYLDSC